MLPRRPLFCFSVLLLALAGCSTPRPTMEPSEPVAEPAVAERASAEDRSDLEALYWQRQDEARQNFTAADVNFMGGMIGHHAQALVMSYLAPERDASPAVRTLAARIINAQRDEIASMQRWLRDRDQPVPTVHIDGLILTLGIEGTDIRMDHSQMDHGGMDHAEMDHGQMEHDAMDHEGMDHDEMDHAKMDHEGMDHDGMKHEGMGHDAMMDHDMGLMDHSAMDHSSMPGMLSQAQLEELAAARGPAFDRLFLRYMIQHHGGAVTMVDDLFATDGAALDEAAFKLASDINADQTTEIARMQLMLDGLEAEQ